MIKIRKNAPEGELFLSNFLDREVGHLIPFRRGGGVSAYKLVDYAIEENGKSVVLTLEDPEPRVREEMRTFRNAD